MVRWLCLRRNEWEKGEARISKFETISNNQNSNDQNKAYVYRVFFLTFDIRIYFGFRYSDFKFHLTKENQAS
jgi:hypothetical protein